MGLRKFKVKITKGHYEASAADDLRRTGLSHAFVPLSLVFPLQFYIKCEQAALSFHLPLSTSITFGEMQREHFNWIAMASYCCFDPHSGLWGLHCSWFAGLICQGARVWPAPAKPYIQILGSQLKTYSKLCNVKFLRCFVCTSVYSSQCYSSDSNIQFQHKTQTVGINCEDTPRQHTKDCLCYEDVAVSKMFSLLVLHLNQTLAPQIGAKAIKKHFLFNL